MEIHVSPSHGASFISHLFIVIYEVGAPRSSSFSFSWCAQDNVIATVIGTIYEGAFQAAMLTEEEYIKLKFRILDLALQQCVAYFDGALPGSHLRLDTKEGVFSPSYWIHQAEGTISQDASAQK